MSIKEIYYVVLAALAAIGTTIAHYMGGWDGLTKLLAFVMVADYLTGALCAAFWHKSPKTPTGGYESNAGFKGLVRKGVIALIVMVAAELDNLTGTTAMRTATILFFAANEGMSILENLGIMGVPYPPALANAFEILRRKSDDKSDKPPDVPTVDASPATSADDVFSRHDLPDDERDVSGLMDEDD